MHAVCNLGKFVRYFDMFRYIIIMIYEVPTALRGQAAVQKLVGSKYRKLLKGLSLEVRIFGGDYTGRKICVSKSVRLILREISAPSREPYQTVRAVYFILDILITDL